MSESDVFDIQPAIRLVGIAREEGPSFGAGKIQKFTLPDGRVLVATPAKGSRWNVSDTTFNSPHELGMVFVRKIRGIPAWTVSVAQYRPKTLSRVFEGHWNGEEDRGISHALSYMYPKEIIASQYQVRDARFDDRLDALMCGVALLAEGRDAMGVFPVVRNDMYPEEGAA